MSTSVPLSASTLTDSVTPKKDATNFDVGPDLEDLKTAEDQEWFLQSVTLNVRSSAPNFPERTARTHINTLRYPSLFKKVLDSMPAARNRPINLLNQEADEHVSLEIDNAGEAKIDVNGLLLGQRQYRVQTFTLPSRSSKLYMLAEDCAKALRYPNLETLFQENPALYEVIATSQEEGFLVARNIVPYSYRSRWVVLVTARSIFRQFGSLIVQGGRRVRDDYWETDARRQGYTEEDLTRIARPELTKVEKATIHAIQHLQRDGLIPGSENSIHNKMAPLEILQPLSTLGNQSHPTDAKSQPLDFSHGQRCSQKDNTINSNKPLDTYECVLRGARVPGHRNVPSVPSQFGKERLSGDESSILSGLSYTSSFSQPFEKDLEDRNSLKNIHHGKIMQQELHKVKHNRSENFPSSSPLVSTSNDGNPTIRNSLLIAICAFYNHCRQTVELATCISEQQLISDLDPLDTVVVPLQPPADTSSGPARKRKASNVEPVEADESGDSKANVVFKKPRRKSMPGAELPCWWYMNDPVRYHACRNYCSRKRDLHSFRRHHFEDHWRWGDIQTDGMSFETWNSAKHATCDQSNLSANERARRKWERTYQILFELRAADPVPEPRCPDFGHIHYRPKRPIRCELPPAQQDTSLGIESNRCHHQTEPLHTSALDDLRYESSAPGGTNQPFPTPHLFPELTVEEHGDPFSSQYFTAWHDQFNIASDLIRTSPSTTALQIVIDDHLPLITGMLQSLYNEPQQISRDHVAPVLQLAHNFASDLARASTDINYIGGTRYHAAYSLEPYHYAAPTVSPQIDNHHAAARSGRSWSAHPMFDISSLSQRSEGQSDSHTIRSEVIDAPGTPRLTDDADVLIYPSDADELTDATAPDAVPMQTSKSSYLGQQDFHLPDGRWWNTQPD